MGERIQIGTVTHTITTTHTFPVYEGDWVGFDPVEALPNEDEMELLCNLGRSGSFSTEEQFDWEASVSDRAVSDGVK